MVNKFNNKDITRISALVALVAIFSQISLPMPHGIPLTMQVFAIVLISQLLKPFHAFICITIYILLGIFGVPVFANFSGGIERILGPTGGFIFGFYILSYILYLSQKANKSCKIFFTLIAVIIFHLIGVVQYSIVMKTTIINSIIIVSIPYFLKDIILIYVAILISKKLNKNTTV